MADSKISGTLMLPGNYYFDYGLMLYDTKFQIGFVLSDGNRNGRKFPVDGVDHNGDVAVVDNTYDIAKIVSNAIQVYQTSQDPDVAVDTGAIESAVMKAIMNTFAWLG